MSAPEPVFEAPWHAQLFALTVHLSERGLFDWPSWTMAFGDTLRRHGKSAALNGGDDYFRAWLDTLESLLDANGVSAQEERAAMRRAWEEAYLSTPHGSPVRLRR